MTCAVGSNAVVFGGGGRGASQSGVRHGVVADASVVGRRK